jgi:hypothetical protein
LKHTITSKDKSMQPDNIIEKYHNLVVSLVQQKPKGKLVNLNDEVYFMFNFKSTNEFYDDYLMQTSVLAFGDFRQNESMPKIGRDQRIAIFEIEQYERDMVISGLKFSTHINISKFKEPETSRRFLTFNDSCLSFVQVSVDDDYYRWMFVSRSTEVNRMLPSDLYTIGLIIKEWTSWFRNYTRTHDRGIKLTIVLNNPHYYKG